MRRRTPLTPILSNELRRGAIVTGNTPGIAISTDPYSRVVPSVTGLELDVDWRNLTDWPEGWSGTAPSVGSVPVSSDSTPYWTPDGLARSDTTEMILTGSGAIPLGNYMTFAVKMKGLYFGASTSYESLAGFYWRWRVDPTTHFLFSFMGAVTKVLGTGSDKYEARINQSSVTDEPLNDTTADQWFYAAVVVHRRNFRFILTSDALTTMVTDEGPNFGGSWTEMDDSLNMHKGSAFSEGVQLKLKSAILQRSALYHTRSLRFIEVKNLFEKWGHPGLTSYTVEHP